MQWVIQTLQVIVFFAAFGVWVDKQATRAQNKKTAQQLQQDGGGTLAEMFVNMFDGIFDPRGRGRPLFLRAGMVSCAALAVLSLNWIGFQRQRAAPALEITLSTWEGVFFNATTLIIFVIVLNLIGDYFSLWETRFVLRQMSAARKKAVQFSWLILDLAATIAIYCIGFTLAMLLLAYLYPPPSGNYGFMSLLREIGALLFGVFFEGGLIFSHSNVTTDPFALFFYTSLVTSVWVWGFMLGVIAWSVFGPLLPRVLGVLYTRNPVTCVMAISGFCIALGLTAVRLIWRALLLLPGSPAS